MGWTARTDRVLSPRPRRLRCKQAEYDLLFAYLAAVIDSPLLIPGDSRQKPYVTLHDRGLSLPAFGWTVLGKPFAVEVYRHGMLWVLLAADLSAPRAVRLRLRDTDWECALTMPDQRGRVRFGLLELSGADAGLFPHLVGLWGHGRRGLVFQADTTVVRQPRPRIRPSL